MKTNKWLQGWMGRLLDYLLRASVERCEMLGAPKGRPGIPGSDPCGV